MLFINHFIVAGIFFVIDMALCVGQFFSEYKALQEAIAQQKRLQKGDVRIRNSQRIDSATARKSYKTQIKPELIYQKIKYFCVFGGRKSKGFRLYILSLDEITEFWIRVDFFKFMVLTYCY